jgi:hypothetical protein
MWPLRASTQPSGELPFVGLFWVWGPLPLFLGPQHSPIVSRTWLGCRTQLEHRVRGGCSLAGPAGRIDLVAIRLCSSELTSTTLAFLLTATSRAFGLGIGNGMERSCSGVTMNIAARLEAAAPVGGILISRARP